MADKWARKEYERICEEANKNNLTFREYADQFYREGCPHEADRKASGKTFGLKTRFDNRYRLENYVFPDPISDMRLCDITRPDSLKFRDRLIKSIGYTRKAQQTIITYKNIINYALSRGVINTDPAARISIKLKDKGKRPAAKVDNVKSILLKKNWPNQGTWLAAMTAGMVGLRAGELCGLRWQDISKEKKVICIARSYNLYEGIKETKSGKIRIAPYPDVLQAIIEPFRGDPQSYAFSVIEGEPLHYHTLLGAMRRAMRKITKEDMEAKRKASGDTTKITKKELDAATGRITLHGLRHSINTALLEAGVNPELLLASFGWIDKETQEIYTHRELYNLAPQREATDTLFEGYTGE
jgi:integrase